MKKGPWKIDRYYGGKGDRDLLAFRSLADDPVKGDYVRVLKDGSWSLGVFDGENFKENLKGKEKDREAAVKFLASEHNMKFLQA
jgi:hypothetical protein